MSDDAFRRLVLSAVILVGTLVYANTLAFREINFDGIMFILNNPLLKDFDYYVQLSDLRDFSSLDEQLGLNSDITTSFMLRPVAYLTFSINYMMSGFNPVGFRAVNLAIHIINSLLVFSCIRLLFGLAPSCRSLSRYSDRFIPTASAFIFLLHPMQTESVTYIMQRFASLAALFYLATIWLYLVWLRGEQRGAKHGYARWGSLLVLLCGMLVRESLFTAPLMIVLLEVTVFGNCFKAGLRRAALHLMLMPLIPIMVILVSAAQTNSSASFSGALNVVNFGGISSAHYALTQMVVVLTYIRLYLLPYGQNLDHDHTLYTLPYQLPVIGAALIIVFLVGGSFLLYRRNREDVRCVLVFVGVCWYFLALSVSSSFCPQPDLMAEHRAYFGSVGVIMAFICLVDLLRTAVGTERMSSLIVVWILVWCGVLTFLTYKRNNMWRSGISLWSDSAKKSPAKYRPWYNLGIAYYKSGNYSEALKCLHKAVKIEPGFDDVYQVFGMIYLHLERYQDMAEASLRGINYDPANPVFYNNLGIAYNKMGRSEDAKQAFTTAIDLRPGYENAMLNKAEIEAFMESSAVRRRQ